MSADDRLRYNDRGFAFCSPVGGSYGDIAEVYESSNAEKWHVWIAVTDRHGRHSSCHLDLTGAAELRDDLTALIERGEM